MYNVQKDPRIWVNFRDGRVKVYKDVDDLANDVFIDDDNTPYLDFGVWGRTEASSIVHTWNDKNTAVITRYDIRNSFGWPLKEVNTVYDSNDAMIFDADDRILGHGFIRTLAKEDKGWSKKRRHDDRKSVRHTDSRGLKHGDICTGSRWRCSSQNYGFRRDPVPGVHNWHKGGPSYKHTVYIRILREANASENDGSGVTTRRKHKNSIIDFWGDRRRSNGWSGSSRSWKNRKITKQWMKNA